MTPTQLRAFATVVRRGSVKAAAAELAVTEAAVSGHVAQLRRQLGDPLFTRTASGLAFTPGGLRLASRANELLGLQDQTVREVGEAARGQRLLRLIVSSMFAEYAAPGLIELFAARARDLQVEMSVRPAPDHQRALTSRAADVVIGPTPPVVGAGVSVTPFLRYEVVVLAAPGHPLAGRRARPAQLQRETWLLGPSAAERGVVTGVLRVLGVPEDQQRIFQSHAAALEEARRGQGVTVALAHAAAPDLAAGRLARVAGEGTQAGGTWSALTLADQGAAPTAAELRRFITTPRAIQAMLSGAGADVARFRPALHVTLWS
jgi:DNA-binding transcriptional LysR family regulator